MDGSGNIIPGQSRDTALKFRYSGIWNRCWMELTPGSFGTEFWLSAYVNAHVPEADGIAVVLNETGGGGCSRGSHFAVTRNVGWGTFAHEFGHFFGKLGDEYQCSQGSSGCGTYTGSMPGSANLTNTTVRSNVEWKSWIPWWRPVPTAQANVADNQQDAGVFAGATIGSGQWWNGIFRPSWRGRMNNNTPRHNPIGYTRVRGNARPHQDVTFRQTVSGDFNGDGLDDLVMIDDRQLSLYLADLRDVGPNDPVKGSPPRSTKGVLEPTWYHTGPLWNSAESWKWISRSNDILIPGDFDGDGMTDLYVANLTDWDQPYLCLLKSFGDRFEPTRIYATDLPGWEMGLREVFHLGDFNGDGRDDIVAFETKSWSQVHFRIYTSSSSHLVLTDRHYGTIGGFWQMRRRDRLYALDFEESGTTGLAIFNGFDWGPVYLGLMRVIDSQLAPAKRYDNDGNGIPGWQMRRRDRFRVSDANGDGRDDLVVYNARNWSTEYLGMLRSVGNGNLQGTWQDGWVGGWNLGNTDDFHVADFRGLGGWNDLVVFNKNWLGLLRSHSNHYKLEAIYPKWIHNHRYHSAGWW